MKKLATALVSLAAAASLVPAAAQANGTTTTDAASGEVPPACTEVLETIDVGPARATHGQRPMESAELPNCDDIEGICVILLADSAPAGGPARAAHSRPRGQDGPPCTPVDDSCNIYVNLDDINGPARAAHQARPTGPVLESVTVEIPEACQEALSLAAIPDAGSDSATIMWLGAALVGIGGALVLTRRTALVRSR